MQDDFVKIESVDLPDEKCDDGEEHLAINGLFARAPEISLSIYVSKNTKTHCWHVSYEAWEMGLVEAIKDERDFNINSFQDVITYLTEVVDKLSRDKNIVWFRPLMIIVDGSEIPHFSVNLAEAKNIFSELGLEIPKNSSCLTL